MLVGDKHMTPNQELLREVNQRIRDVAGLDTTIFVCECSNMDCFGTLELSLEQYDGLRKGSALILKPDHANPTVENTGNAELQSA